MNLVRVRKTTHTTHDTEDVVVGRVDTNFRGRCTFNAGVRKNKLKCGVVNAREVACARWLMFFGAESKRVNINTSVGSTCVVLEWLDKVEVCTFTLREAVLAIEL